MTDLKAVLVKLNKNLNILKERQAKYGDNPPLELINQVEDHDKAISLTKQAIDGELSVTNAASTYNSEASSDRKLKSNKIR